MKRPAIQFYTSDWRSNPDLRRSSPAARGVMVDMLCVFNESPEYGVVRWPLAELAAAAGASLSLVRELVEKGLLKGADAGAAPYVHTPRHAGKEGEPVTLVEARDGPCWYCSRMVRDEWIRKRRGASTRFDADRQPPPISTPSRSPTRRVGGRQGGGPTSSSSTSSSKKKNPHSPQGGTAFESFWTDYPRKEAKARAEKAFAKVLSEGGSLETLLARLQVWRACDQWTKDGGKFVPHAATWLNGRRWEDEAPARSVSSSAARTFAGGAYAEGLR
ncbi:MAG: hypothetical protein K8R60_04475 [Burkholderiales bacterium]|nr:hypothetical protein [Burkholderiales bacterium]